MDIEHTLRVASHFMVGSDPWIVGLLHDFLEDIEDDNEFVRTVDILKMGLPQKAVDAIVDITRRKDEVYKDYIKRLDGMAAMVKIADLQENLNRMDEAHASLEPRYAWALNFLLGE